jgi:hypothetical protein
MYHDIAPAPKSYTAQIRVWAQLSEMFARTKTRVHLAVTGLWDSLSRTFLRLATPFSLATLLTRWQQRQPGQSARDHEAKRGGGARGPKEIDLAKPRENPIALIRTNPHGSKLISLLLRAMCDQAFAVQASSSSARW